MKLLTIMGVLTLFLLLVIPGAVSAADVAVSGGIVGVGVAFFANEPGVVPVTVMSTGGMDAVVMAWRISEIAGKTYEIYIEKVEMEFRAGCYAGPQPGTMRFC